VPPLLIILILIGIAAFGFVAWQQDKKRREALRVWAAGRSWNIDTDRQRDWHQRFPGLKLFTKGHSRWGRNIVTGQFRDRPATALDYKYTTGSGKNRTTHRVSLVILQVDFPTIPLFIRRENPFDKVGEFFGADDIDFESAEFSRKFYVKSPDKRWAYDVIHTRAMEYLLKAPSFNIEFGHGEIAVYRGGWPDPDRHEQALKLAGDLLDMIPDYVIKQLKGAN